MTRGLSSLFGLFAALALLLPAVGTRTAAAPPLVEVGASSQTIAPDAPAVQATIDWGRMPVYFVENQGQLDKAVDYYVQGSDKTIYFTATGVTFALTVPPNEPAAAGRGEGRWEMGTGHSVSRLPDSLRESGRWQTSNPDSPSRWAVKLDFLGANPDVHPVGEERQDAVVSYFKGRPDQWHAGLPTYGRLVYRDLWPGIDLAYYGTVNRLKYEFVVHPGVNPAQIRLAYRGATDVGLNAAGQLEVATPLEGFADDTPVAYQEMDGQRMDVAAAYDLTSAAYALSSSAQGRGKGEQGDGVSFSFAVGPYDPAWPLVLDPAVLLYCGYIGGSGGDQGWAIAVDGLGNAYVTGTTDSAAGFPLAVGPDLTFGGDVDAFVAKVRADGTGLVYCGYIGGFGEENGNGIAVDSAGNAYVTGETSSSEAAGFPVTVGPDLTYNGGDYDAFVAKVRVGGMGLVYAGYIGGSLADYGMGIAVDGAGNAYVTGDTRSSEAEGFPVAVGPDLTFNGADVYGGDAFVAKVEADGTALDYCGYIGGWDADGGRGIAVDGMGNAYVTGTAYSSEAAGFPVTQGPDLSYNGGEADAFVVKVRAGGTGLVYAGYIGGWGADGGSGIAVDSAGNAYVTGETQSSEAEGFPVAVGPDLTYNGDTYLSGDDAFVTEVRADGTGLVYCGYIGGSEQDWSLGLAVDGAGNAYVTGFTSSSENEAFPVTVGPDLTFNGGDFDAFVVKVRADGTGLAYAGYIGGSDDDYGLGIAVDGSGNAYVTGVTYSSENEAFPVTVGPDLTFNGDNDAFVAKISVVAAYSISGHVAAGGADLEGITVSAGAGGSAISDASGDYLIADVLPGTYTLTPSKPGYSFSPKLRTVSVPPDATDEDFTGIQSGEKRPVILVPGMMASVNWDPLCFFARTNCGTRQDWEWTPLPTGGNAKVVYDRLIAEFELAGYTSKNHFLTVVLYDWRRPIGDNVDWLREAIDEAKAQTGASQVDIIGHSMGGLLGRAYVQDTIIPYENDVAHLITLGSPHYGSAKVYPYWEAAFLYRMLPTEKILCPIILHYLARSQGAIGSYLFLQGLRAWAPSALEVMPTSGYVDDGQAQSGYLYDEDQGDQLKPESTMHHKNTYLAALNANLPTLFARTSVTAIFGQNVETPVRFYVDGAPWPSWDDGEPNWSRETPGFMSFDGDGTVWAKSASLPTPGGQVPVSGVDHGGLVGDEDVIGAIFDTLGIPEPLGGQLAMPAEQTGTGLLVLAVYGPSDAKIADPNGHTVGPSTTSILGARYLTDPTGAYKLILIPNPVEGSFDIDVEGHDSGQYELALLDIFNPPPDLVDDVMTLWDSSQSQIEPAVTVGYALTYTLETSRSTSLVAVTPVIDVPVWVGSTAVSGRARPGHQVEIRNADTGAVLAAGTARSDGHFRVLLAAPLHFRQRICPWSNGLAGVAVRVQAHVVYLPLGMRRR